MALRGLRGAVNDKLIAEIVKLNEANEIKASELDAKLFEVRRRLRPTADTRQMLLDRGFSEQDISRLRSEAEARWIVENSPDPVDEFSAFETTEAP